MNFIVILFLTFSHLSLTPRGEKEDDKNKSNELQLYLPFVMIHLKDDSFAHPNVIEKGTFNKQSGFSGDIQFSKDDSTKQQFFCPPDTEDEKNEIELASQLYRTNEKTRKLTGHIKLDEKCLVKKNFKKDESVKCSSEAEPSIYMIFDEEDGQSKLVLCGPDLVGNKYKFMYQICPPTTIFERAKLVSSHIWQSDLRQFYREIPFWYHEVIIYEICFDLKTGGTIYTKHTLSSVPLLFDERLNHERSKKFNLSENGPAYMLDKFLKIKDLYKEMENSSDEIDIIKNENLDLEKSSDDAGTDENENTESNNPTRLAFKPHFLVSPNDMPTAILRKPSFHYINVKPMHRNLIGLWNFIEDTIREALKEDDTPYVVYTGAFTTSDQQNYSKIPDLWVKIIYYNYKSNRKSNPAIAFVMKNNDTDGPSLADYCVADYCDPASNGGALVQKFPQATEVFRCCSLNSKIENLFGIGLKKDHLMDIPGLTTKKNTESKN